MPSSPTPSNPSDSVHGSPGAAWVTARVMTALVFVVSAGPIATDWLVGRAAFDHLQYHLPAIERFMTDLPAVDLVDYASATTPGYHLGVAAVGRAMRASPVGLRWIGLWFTLILIGWVGHWLGKQVGWMALALALPIMSSPYIYASGVWLLPDNAGWLGVWAVLVLILSPARGSLKRWLAISVALLLLVLVRQIHLWALGPVMVAAWLDAPAKTSDEPPLSVRESFGVLKPTWSRVRGSAGALALGLPAIVLLGVFVKMWGGLVPPRFASFHAHGGSPSAASLFLTLFAGYGIFFFAWWWDGMVTLVRSRRVLLLTAISVGLLSAVLPHTDFSLDRGRYGALWSAVERFPAVAHRSVLVTAMAPVGAVILAAWLMVVDLRTRWIMLAACAGFIAASSTNSIAGQRYYEPMVLFTMVLLAGQHSRHWAPSARRRLLAWVGPEALGFMLAALTIITLSRSPNLSYPRQPLGTMPITTTTP